MKAIMLSIQPYYVFLIIARLMGWNIPQDKTVEVRKDFPRDKVWNKLVHIYSSKNRKSFNRIPKEYQPLMEKLLGKVIGEFVCDRIYEIEPYNTFDAYWWNFDFNIQDTCLSENELEKYLLRKNKEISIAERVYGWHISDLKIYDTPKALGEFIAVCKTYYSDNDDKCWGCPNLRVIDGNKEAYQGNCISRHKPLTRPPQSWQYVEPLEEN